MQDQLKGVQEIQASHAAFAAILDDGSVVTWGHEDLGGESRPVQDRLNGVQQIQASSGAFAAILMDGSVVTRGPRSLWWQKPCCARSAERRTADPSLWAHFCSYPDRRTGCHLGPQRLRWDSCAVQDQLKGVQQIQESERAFAAILSDGSVVSWGNSHFGGDSRAVQDQLKGVQQIQASHDAFAAILDDGSVVTWGHEDLGGESRAVQDQLNGV